MTKYPICPILSVVLTSEDHRTFLAVTSGDIVAEMLRRVTRCGHTLDSQCANLQQIDNMSHAKIGLI